MYNFGFAKSLSPQGKARLGYEEAQRNVDLLENSVPESYSIEEHLQLIKEKKYWKSELARRAKVLIKFNYKN